MLVTVPRLMIGQTVEDVVNVSDRLRTAVGSRQVRIVPNDTHTGCTVRFLFADPLAAIIEASFPAPNLAPNITYADMGITENGDRWLMPIQLHTLTAGATGSGKASAMWMLMLNLAPAIKAGLVQVHGIDLKGGVEQAMGLRLFTRHATTLEEAVVLMEDAVTAMLARSAKLAGHARSHTPTPAEPLVIVVIDELAMLTSYSTDRDLIKRADTALRSLLALGRAPGYIVHGYLQDPRKDTVPQRHLFSQSFALRLREKEEVVMVLTEGAVAAGAACHKIPHRLQGVGYVLGGVRRRHPRPDRLRHRRHDPRPRRALPRTPCSCRSSCPRSTTSPRRAPGLPGSHGPPGTAVPIMLASVASSQLVHVSAAVREFRRLTYRALVLQAMHTTLPPVWQGLDEDGVDLLALAAGCDCAGPRRRRCRQRSVCLAAAVWLDASEEWVAGYSRAARVAYFAELERVAAVVDPWIAAQQPPDASC